MRSSRIAGLATLACALAVQANGPAAAAASAAAGQSRTAFATVVEAKRAARDFYAWYLKELQADREPLRGDSNALANCVAQPLLREIRDQARSPAGLDSDYFLKAQDYADDWLERIEVGVTRIQGSTAKVSVDLGGDPRIARKLWVTLVVENARWKIRKVVAR